MSSSCICIAAPLSRRSRMKIRRLILIDGAATRPGGRKPGSVWLNGYGTSAWSWAINFILIRYARPSLLLLSRLHHHTRPLPPAMLLPSVGSAWKAGRFSGHDFTLQPDGTLRCPANQKLRVQEQRREVDGSLRVVYAASIRSCRPCPLREQCQWQGSATRKPRQVSVLLHPLDIGSEPLRWRDWSRRSYRRACMQLLHHQRVEVQREPGITPNRDVSPLPRSCASRAHSRLSWAERLARNGRAETSHQVTIRLFGVPEGFATSLGITTA
jgi:hypothetical protein